ncbi:MAG: winged helix DNA-binding protein, partial [Gammaproteobacteria bacterium]|nr:winged helix DNA-binding protein [Gammaproteobacteria bacterium]
NNAFQRWAVRCMGRAGEEGLTSLEVMLLHAVNRRVRHGTISDLALLLNLDDTHLINYALKKLEARGLVKAGKRGKEKTIYVTPHGASVCQEYIATRERCLMQMLRLADADYEELARLARILHQLAGSYDHAARAAITD